ncbi:TetR family transcriptional regulator [Flavobacterium rivuli WB 3.3-2 = DSM 21788]|uniref:TetR family transcriptional regulator n=1 Tax=Flavobacterium rivuli WB 3.3-2 = DSM 21788 TaxID=1121895 RepID=A0A0A2M6N8_9FLAO|nr:TetR/AcrR family transcriptional regulator [Flavobacterium rivuli]KGO87954.1 TetR family transcriptional regulator [Flavobacterium rivuli WB 3.3-2 = DSM 21788]
MSAKITDQDTEQLIKDTAKRVFFGEGRFNATTQEIADAAGVNRTLINYYFRSRNNLFDIVFQDAQEQEHNILEEIVFADISFKEKISRNLDAFFEQSKKYPYLEIYMVTQMNQGNCYKDKEHMNLLLDKFYLEVALEMERGNIHKMRPEQFVLNFVSLMSFPVSMRPLLQETMGFTKESYDTLLEERKDVIMNTLFIK